MSGRNKIDKKAKCEICTMDFVGCEDPNLPVKNPCGCIFHEYCLYKYGGSGSYCPGKSCHRTGSSGASGCNNCKDLRREIKQISSENAKLNKKVDQLSEKSSDSVDMRKENKLLTSENAKLNKKVEQLFEKSSISVDLSKENKRLMSEIAKLNKKIEQISKKSKK